MARDYGTMTCDYDHDCFGQGLKFQHSRENGHSYGQKVPSSHRPAVKKQLNNQHFNINPYFCRQIIHYDPSNRHTQIVRQP